MKNDYYIITIDFLFDRKITIYTYKVIWNVEFVNIEYYYCSRYLPTRFIYTLRYQLLYVFSSIVVKTT